MNGSKITSVSDIINFEKLVEQNILNIITGIHNYRCTRWILMCSVKTNLTYLGETSIGI